jgi:hypothetical protein
MKKLLLLFLLGTAALSACKQDDFLEPKTSGLVEETVFTDSTRTVAFLSRIYSDIGFSFNKQRWSSHGTAEHATDDAEYSFSGAPQSAVILYSGTLSPLNLPSNDFWELPWANIRRVNLLLAKLPSTPLSKKMQNRMAAEARFLRVWYYENLLVCFGGIPIIGDKVYGLEDVIDQPRTSYAECVTYLTQELDEIATQLPTRDEYPAADYGRITRGACLAMKSRILLEAASPLFNGGAETTDPSLAALVSYPAYSVSRWQAAADAAQAVINSGYYSLVVDNTTAPGYGFVSMFLQRVNPEYIFFVNRVNNSTVNKDLEFVFLPSTRGGAAYFMPTQNLVDAFPMKNGKAITDPTSGYDPKNPYANREPRFYNSIIYNGARFQLNSSNSLQPVWTYEGAPSDGFNAGNSTTGYYFRKMLDPNIANNSPGITARGWSLMRYAEILLNYAEAINETGQPELAVPKIVELRRRAGIEAGADGRYGIAPGISVAQMRELIRSERRVELSAEDHRWHDIRRWKTAMVISNAYNLRMRIVQSSPTAAPTSYNIVPTIRRHNFRPEMYLLPIPDGEIRKIPAFRQNPGW